MDLTLLVGTALCCISLLIWHSIYFCLSNQSHQNHALLNNPKPSESLGANVKFNKWFKFPFFDPSRRAEPGSALRTCVTYKEMKNETKLSSFWNDFHHSISEVLKSFEIILKSHFLSK